MAKEALRGESIIDEESGCASALSGRGAGTLAQAMAHERGSGRAWPCCWPHSHCRGPARAGVGQELLGSPQGQGAGFPRGLPWRAPVSEPPSATARPPQVPPACPPYPLGAPAELVLCVPQGHRVLVDIVRHSHHLEHRTPDITRLGDPWAPCTGFSTHSLDPSPTKPFTLGGQPPPTEVNQVRPKRHRQKHSSCYDICSCIQPCPDTAAESGLVGAHRCMQTHRTM